MTRLSVCGLGVSCNEMSDTLMLLVVVCTKDYHYYSFFPRATREWNKLSDAVHATTVEAFKAKLSAAAATDN